MKTKFYLNELLNGTYFDTTELVELKEDEKGFYTTDEKQADLFKRYANGYKIADELGLELDDYEEYVRLSDLENRELDETEKRILSLVAYFLIDNDIEILDDGGYEYFEEAVDIEEKDFSMKLNQLFIELEYIVDEKVFNPYIHQYIDYFYVKDNKLGVAIRLQSEEEFNDYISLQ